MIRHLLLGCLVACSTPSPSPAPATPPAPAAPVAAKPTPDPLVAKLDAAATAALEKHHAVGLAVAVARGDRMIVAKGYGFADVAKHTVPTADTVFRIGSITKQFTAIAILQLVDEGKLALTDDIRTYLPDFRPPGPDRKPRTITIEHLLTHTSGIFDYTSLPDWLEVGAKPMSRAELVALFATKPLAFAPGERWAYSNSNYYLLGLVIEKLTNRPYADVVRDRVLAPAGLTASAYCDDALPNHATGYHVGAGGPEPAKPLDLAHPYAAGSLCSTANDLVRWQRALDTGKLVSPGSLAKMRTAAKLADGSSTGYGYGVMLGELDGHPRIAHGGGINGFTSMLARYPKDDVTIVVLANAESSAPDKLEAELARIVLGLAAPTVKDLALAPTERARLLGRYEVKGFGADGLALQVFEEAGKLRMQATGQPAATLLYQGDGKFAIDVDPSIVIEFPTSGAHAAKLTIHQSGLHIPATRVK
ncbi:MAG TPA: serine hydrolase domain-containing protein [Kofleriaceae bacterium]|nr:serine hydrolase domain-containing protein [Kofleriaceae bacterium]